MELRIHAPGPGDIPPEYLEKLKREEDAKEKKEKEKNEPVIIDIGGEKEENDEDGAVIIDMNEIPEIQEDMEAEEDDGK